MSDLEDDNKSNTGPTGSMLSGWGRLFGPGREVRSEDLEDLSSDAVLSRGLGRSYGDSSLPPPTDPTAINTTLADRLLSFDEKTGVIRGEAGFSILELNRLFIPRGWFSPVTPGTQYVTLGGMVAADVHGKNHHCDGCFGAHVSSLLMRVADGRVLECTPENHPNLFRATVGGMGLTGHILEVEFKLKTIPSPWIWQETERVNNIDDYIGALKTAAPNWPYTVGWIDCLSRGNKMGRGILMKGRWAEPNEASSRFPKPKRRITFPFDLPSWVLNPLSIRLFNFSFFWKHLPKEKRGIIDPESFFYPLDAILEWNRMYGRKGFTQYQCVLPESAGHGAAREFLELLTSKGGASFLCVIKDCGAQGEGILSFPMPGISIALDIPVRSNTQALVDALNGFVLEKGGRIYLAKDSFTRGADYRAMDLRVDEFLDVRRRWDPEQRFRSAQSVRIFGDRP